MQAYMTLSMSSPSLVMLLWSTSSRQGRSRRWGSRVGMSMEGLRRQAVEFDPMLRRTTHRARGAGTTTPNRTG